MTRRLHLLAALLAVTLAAPALAKDPIILCEANGACYGFGSNGLIDFAKEYEKNPRDLTLSILEHPFGFDATPNACGTACTSLRFTSAEMGLDRTFTGNNTAEVSRAFQDFVKSEEFLKPFIRLINTGPGGQITGSPVGAVGATVRATFHDLLFSTVRTAEQKQGAPAGKDPSLSTSFGQFKDSGYDGDSIGVTPSFTLDFGKDRDRHLKLSIPLSRISIAGLKTYRGGVVSQYLHPVYLPHDLTLTVGPGLSYTAMGSLDLPNFSGVMGGALAATLNKDWKKAFATVGSYYGHFVNLGGIDTDTSANVYGWGAQTGYRFAQRWVGSLFLVGLHELVAGQPSIGYQTLGTSLTYRILNKFDLTFSLSKPFGLPNKRFTEFGLGSAWFF